MKNANIITNTETAVTVTRFCCECGSKFDATSKQARICPTCAAAKKATMKEKQAAYAKERQEKLGLVNVTVSKATRDWARAEAQKKGMSIYQVIDALVTQAQQVTQAPAESAEEEKPKEPAKPNKTGKGKSKTTAKK